MSKNLNGGFTDFCHYVGSLSSGKGSNKKFKFREEFTNIFYASYRKYMNKCGYARRHMKKKRRKPRWRVKEDHISVNEINSMAKRLKSLEVHTAALEKLIKSPKQTPNILINGEEQVFLNYSAPDDRISSDPYAFREPYFEQFELGLDQTVRNDSEEIKFQEKRLYKLAGEVEDLSRDYEQLEYEHNYWLGILDAFVMNVSVSYSLDLGDLRAVLDNLILVNPQSEHLDDVPVSDVTMVSLTLDQIDIIKSDPKVDSTNLSITPEPHQDFKPDIMKISPVIRQHSRQRTKLKAYARCSICTRVMYTEYKCTKCDVKSCYYCRGRWGACYDEYMTDKSKEYTFVQPSDKPNKFSKIKKKVSESSLEERTYLDEDSS